MQFFLLTASFRVLFERLYLQGGGPNATPLYAATPTFYSHAHKDYSIISVDLAQKIK